MQYMGEIYSTDSDYGNEKLKAYKVILIILSHNKLYLG